VGRPQIVSRSDLRRLYPYVELDGFEPTHWVRLLDSHERGCLREDYVRLEHVDDAVSYAYVPGEAAPVYGVLTTGLWQCLVVHGRPKVLPVRYEEGYVQPLEREGVVYFVQSGDDGPIKIGWTQDVERRIAELQTANAHPLRLLGEVPGRMRDEAAMHARFSHLRMEAEWFRNSLEIHVFLKEGR